MMTFGSRALTTKTSSGSPAGARGVKTPCSPVRSKAPNGWWMNIAHPLRVPMSHCTGARVPWVSSRNGRGPVLRAPWPLRMSSIAPLRSNCAPPSPKPKRGPSPRRNDRFGVVGSSVRRCTSLPAAVATWIVGGDDVKLTMTSPARTCDTAAASRARTRAVPNSSCASAPVTGTGRGFPACSGRTEMRTVAGLTDHTAISTGCPAMTMSAAPPRMTPANIMEAPEQRGASVRRGGRRCQTSGSTLG